jgi:hypothetical protein
MEIRIGLVKGPGAGLSAFEMHLMPSTCSQITRYFWPVVFRVQLDEPILGFKRETGQI